MPQTTVASVPQAFFEETALWASGQGGYDAYRAPAMVTTTRGTVLAFCEGRQTEHGNAGRIDLLLRRSFDSGQSWGPVQLVATEAGTACSSPGPVVDRKTGIVWLPFCKNPRSATRDHILLGRASRGVWLTHSTDEGHSWPHPVEVTRFVKDPAWTWYATGPGHAVQLASGRLVVPCSHVVGKGMGPQDPHEAHVIYSDDHGLKWKIGGSVGPHCCQSTAVELADGGLYVNCRNAQKPLGVTWPRLVARSADGGLHFGPPEADPTLIEPVCQASVVRLTHAREHGRDRLLFANPASAQRQRLTVRLSYDEGRTWPVSKLVQPGPAAYCDLAVGPDRTILLAYESEDGLRLARFNLAWVTEEKEC